MWELTSTNSTLLNRITLDEGSISYQKKIGTFKNGVFVQYNDTLGKPTIGYGHLVLLNESFNKGLTPDKALSLLSSDLSTAVDGAKSLYEQNNLSCPLYIQIILTCLVFQIGKSGVAKFKKFLGALKKQDYELAAQELKNSKLYTQTPNRIQNYISQLTSGNK